MNFNHHFNIKRILIPILILVLPLWNISILTESRRSHHEVKHDSYNNHHQANTGEYLFESPIDCGRGTHDISDLKPRIANGDLIKNVEEFPAYAAITYDTNHSDSHFFCGGTFIDKDLVLTAGHCMSGELKYVRVITNRLQFLKRHSIKPYFEIDKVCMSRKFYLNDRPKNIIGATHDYAIIRLKEPLKELNNTINVSCFPKRHMEIGESGVIFAIGPEAKFTYMKSRLRECKLEAERKDNSVLCTRPLKLGGVCQGDSGSPYVYYENGRHYIAGIISYAENEQCISVKNTQEVYTDVYNMRYEISKLVQECRSNGPSAYQ